MLDIVCGRFNEISLRSAVPLILPQPATRARCDKVAAVQALTPYGDARCHRRIRHCHDEQRSYHLAHRPQEPSMRRKGHAGSQRRNSHVLLISAAVIHAVDYGMHCGRHSPEVSKDVPSLLSLSPLHEIELGSLIFLKEVHGKANNA